MESGALNSIKMQQIEDQYGVAMSSKIGEINQKYRNRGVQIKLIDNAEVNRLKNIYGQSRVDEDFTQDKDGNYYRIVATSPKAGEALQDAVTAIGDVMEDVSIINIANKVLGGDDKKEDAPTTTETKTQVKEETTTDRPTEPATGDTRNFGQLDSGEFTSFNKSIEYFGQLNRDKDVLQMEIDAINQMLQGQNLNLPRVKAKFKDSIDKRNRSEKKLKDIENEIKQAEDDARQTSEKLAASDREAASKIASDYNSRVNERAEKRRKESEARRKAEATKTTEQRQSEKEQRSSNFRKMSRDIASFRDKFRR
jgi:hypothetical protein